MKKETLLGMEVYYEDNPQPTPAPKPGVPEGVWVFGDSDEEDDFDNFDDVFESGPFESHYLEPESHPVPIRGRIYSVAGLNITAKLKEIRPLTKTAGILEMSHHDNIFYINPSALRKASPKQVTHYLEESDYNNTP
jgi:hypothetical protein